MKIYIYLILSLLSITWTNAQQNGIIEYEYSYHPNIGKKPTDYAEYKAISSIDKAAEYAKKHNYILEFNLFESLYYKEEGLKTDDIEDPLAYGLSKMIMGKGIYYQNTKRRYQINQKESLHQLLLVRDSIRNNWVLTYEKKTILGFNCYKATKNCSCGKDIIVWYTPDIPLPFGPAGYNGTPGLILEISFFRHTLTAKKIKLKKETIKIEKPVEGIPITQAELESKMWDKRMKIMDKYNRKKQN